MNRLFLWIISCWSVLLISCSGDRLYEEFRSLEGDSWQVVDTLNYPLGNLNEEARLDLVAVRYTDSYPFSNLYVRFLMEDSTGKELENKLVNIPLFDSKSGKPLGKGFGNSHTWYDTLPFLFPKETAQVRLIQYMRKEQVEGIQALGLKIIKSQ